MKESMITVRFAGYYIISACALLLAAEVTHSFFFTLFTAHTFLILIWQTAIYKTHACWLTLITHGCGVLRSTRVLHTILKRHGTRSNRLGTDSADYLKYRPEPYGSRILRSPVKTSSLYLLRFIKVFSGTWYESNPVNNVFSWILCCVFVLTAIILPSWWS